MSVLCFIDGDWPILFPPDEFEGVRLESQRSIVKLLTRTKAIEERDMAIISNVLGSALPAKLA